MESSAGTMIVSLLFMLGLLVAAYFLSRRMGAPAGCRKSRYMKAIDRLAVGKDRWIEMVQVGGEVMVVGVTGHTMEVLKTLPADALRENKAAGQEDPFRNILDKLMFRKN